MTRPHQPGSYVPAVNSSGDKDGDWYVIRVQGLLDGHWSAWLDGLAVSHGNDGTTVLSGPVADQAALHGLLHKLRDIGLPLLSVARTDPD